MMRTNPASRHFEWVLRYNDNVIAYISSAAEVKASQLQGFFVGWPSPPTPQTHLKLLLNSDQVILAIDIELDVVVGFITAITDHVLTAYIPLVEVLPSHQHQGIGSELVHRMLERISEFYMIDLLCDPQLQAFYEAAGMKRGTGMLIRNYQKQAGMIDLTTN